MESSVRYRLGSRVKHSESTECDAKDLNDDKEVRLVFPALVLIRLINVFLVRTSFVPDEYWQSVEVAHRFAFGYGHLTWEWQVGLRSFAYPAVFSAAFTALHFFGIDTPYMIIYFPRIMQGLFTAIGDWYLYLFVIQHCGGCKVARFALTSHMLNWFWWYCSSRTLINTFEATMFCIGLYYYPWPSRANKRKTVYQVVAIFVCVIRPTAAVVWVPMALWHIVREKRSRVFSTVMSYLLTSAFVIAAVVILDRFYYGKWVPVHWNFFMFNVWENKSGVFGSHPWHWYLTQGIPAVLGTQGLFLLVGLYQTMGKAEKSSVVHTCLLALFCITIATYSFLGHKEFRFILQLVPVASVFSGICLSTMSRRLQKYSLAFLLLTNVPVALYTGLIHQGGPLHIVDELRSSIDHRCTRPCDGGVLFLMPCHTTPLYSHIHSNVSTRFLSCYPNIRDEENYVSETDMFYSDPHRWLKTNIDDQVLTGTVPPRHIIIFDKLYDELSEWRRLSEYSMCATSFHSHLPEERSGSNIYLLCHKDIIS